MGLAESDFAPLFPALAGVLAALPPETVVGMSIFLIFSRGSDTDGAASEALTSRFTEDFGFDILKSSFSADF